MPLYARGFVASERIPDSRGGSGVGTAVIQPARGRGDDVWHPRATPGKLEQAASLWPGVCASLGSKIVTRRKRL